MPRALTATGAPSSAGQVELAVVDVDRGDVQTHRPGILDGQVPKAANARDDDPVARSGLGHLQALVHGDARAQDRRDLDELHVGGQVADVVGVGNHILGERAVDRVSSVLLGLAQRFPAGPAVGAVPAGGVQPRDADRVVLLQVCHAGADGRHEPHALMARDERGFRLDRPIAADRVQIGTTHPARPDLHKHLAGPRLGDWHILDRSGLPNSGQPRLSLSFS